MQQVGSSTFNSGQICMREIRLSKKVLIVILGKLRVVIVKKRQTWDVAPNADAIRRKLIMTYQVAGRLVRWLNYLLNAISQLK